MSVAKKSLWLRIATLGPIGYLPKAPGTWGSGAGVLVWVGLSRLPLMAQAAALLGLTALAVVSAHKAEPILGRDAHPIVIDEAAGQALTLLIVPKIWWSVILAFFFFRLFDVWKPFPVGLSQRLPGGWGVVADDILAGLYAALAITLIVDLTGGGR